MDIDADKLAACVQPIAEMARALGAAFPEKLMDFSRAVGAIEVCALEGRGWHVYSNGKANADQVRQDHDLETLVSACAGLADMHPADWMRMRAIDRRIARRPDESGDLIHKLFATGAVQVVITRTDKPGEFRVVVPTLRRGLITGTADGLDEALRRTHTAVDVAR